MKASQVLAFQSLENSTASVATLLQCSCRSPWHAKDEQAERIPFCQEHAIPDMRMGTAARSVAPPLPSKWWGKVDNALPIQANPLLDQKKVRLGIDRSCTQAHRLSSGHLKVVHGPEVSGLPGPVAPSPCALLPRLGALYAVLVIILQVCRKSCGCSQMCASAVSPCWGQVLKLYFTKAAAQAGLVQDDCHVPSGMQQGWEEPAYLNPHCLRQPLHSHLPAWQHSSSQTVHLGNTALISRWYGTYPHTTHLQLLHIARYCPIRLQLTFT